MEQRAHAAFAPRPARWACRGLAAVMACIACVAGGAAGTVPATLSPQELLIVGHAAGFLQPPPSGGAVAVVYAAGDAASRQDADAIASEIGNGLQAGSVLLAVKVVDAGELAKGGVAVAIAASGANGPALGAAVRAARILCVTADLAAVQDGFCTMGITTRPRVTIVLNHAAAAAAGITFAAAFRMMIREI
jgi:hypothetical protein